MSFRNHFLYVHYTYFKNNILKIATQTYKLIFQHDRYFL